MSNNNLLRTHTPYAVLTPYKSTISSLPGYLSLVTTLLGTIVSRSRNCSIFSLHKILNQEML